MIIVSKEQKAGLDDLFKTALACSELELAFALPQEDESVQQMAFEPEGIIAGLAIAFEILGFQIPQLTAADLAEFKEMNGIQ